MNYLYVHYGFGGHHHHVIRHLASDKHNDVVMLYHGQSGIPIGPFEPTIPHVRRVTFLPARNTPTPNIHPYLAPIEINVLNGQAVALKLMQMKQSGYKPDIIISHAGWGLPLFIKQAYPNVPLLLYGEHYTHKNYQPLESHPDPNAVLHRHMGLAAIILALESADAIISPTEYQRNTFPSCFQSKSHVIFDGVDTETVKPEPKRLTMKLANNTIIPPEMEVITYNSRAFELTRGFKSFIEAVALILKERENCCILVSGGTDKAYSGGQLYDHHAMADGLGIDRSRLHFMGTLPYAHYLKLLQRSDVHIYLSRPFVLSWSCMEALAAGCLVVGSDTEPVREMIKDNETGLLADFFSPRDIADKVLYALAHKHEMQHIRENARNFIIKHHSVSAVLPKHEALLNNIIQNFTPPKMPDFVERTLSYTS